MIAIGYIPGQIDSNLDFVQTNSINRTDVPSSPLNDKLLTSSRLAAAGLITMVLPLFLILAWIGSDEEAPVNNIRKSFSEIKK